MLIFEEKFQFTQYHNLFVLCFGIKICKKKKTSHQGRLYEKKNKITIKEKKKDGRKQIKREETHIYKQETMSNCKQINK
jgi:hypothetical protein